MGDIIMAWHVIEVISTSTPRSTPLAEEERQQFLFWSTAIEAPFNDQVHIPHYCPQKRRLESAFGPIFMSSSTAGGRLRYLCTGVTLDALGQRFRLYQKRTRTDWKGRAVKLPQAALEWRRREGTLHGTRLWCAAILRRRLERWKSASSLGSSRGIEKEDA